MSSSGMRKAAAYLATLHPTDRRWLLAQLPVSSVQSLVQLIQEAEPLVLAMPDSLHALLDEREQERIVDVPTPDLLIGALHTLDESWAARMLAAAAADHTEIYLAACFRQRAMGVRSELNALPPTFPPALARCMADELSAMANRVETVAS